MRNLLNCRQKLKWNRASYLWEFASKLLIIISHNRKELPCSRGLRAKVNEAQPSARLSEVNFFTHVSVYDAGCKVIKVDSSIYLELEREATTILFCARQAKRPSKSTCIAAAAAMMTQNFPIYTIINLSLALCMLSQRDFFDTCQYCEE